MLHNYFKIASKVLQNCFTSASKLFQKCFNISSKLLQSSSNNASQWYKNAPKLFQNCFTICQTTLQNCPIASKLLASKLLQFTRRKIQGVRSGNFAECLKIKTLLLRRLILIATISNYLVGISRSKVICLFVFYFIVVFVCWLFSGGSTVRCSCLCRFRILSNFVCFCSRVDLIRCGYFLSNLVPSYPFTPHFISSHLFYVLSFIFDLIPTVLPILNA